MMVGYGIAAWPFLVAKYGLHQRWRVLTALIGVAALLAAALLASSGARAATAVRPSDARSGSLILKTEGEGYIDAARLGIDVDVTVSGPTLRARVTQIFRNTSKDWVEGIYVYPLPDGGAVDTLKMVIGDRVVVGDIKERQQARVIYEQAKQNGQKAALTAQERPNIFTNAVANIGPGETVLVQIEYQEPVHQSGDQFSLRIPMVVGPRPGTGGADRRLAHRREWLGHCHQRSCSGPRSHFAAGPRPEGSRADQTHDDQHPAACGISDRRSEEPFP
jgi:hypothetical protein